jgi:hypothetical protein
MRKILIFGAFFLAIITLLLATVDSVIDSHKQTIDEIAPSTDALKLKAAHMWPSRLTKSEIEEIFNTINKEIIQLEFLQKVFSITIILICLINLVVLYRFNWIMNRFDGLCLLGVALLVPSLNWMVYEFSDYYYGGHNASMNIRIGLLIGTLVIQPALCYIAYRMNKHEISLTLHNQKWITNLALVLSVLSLVIVLAIGIGVLITPDLSGNIT